jgi:hypothetical protein
MKQIKTSELKIGNIFTKKMELYNRQAFEVIDTKEGKDYLTVKERDTGLERKFMTKGIPYVILLREKD